MERISACDCSEATLKRAVELNIIDDYSTVAGVVVADADVVVISTPLSAAEQLLPEIAASLKTGAVLTDVGSVKSGIVNVARAVLAERFPGFVPGHPIAGTEKSGVDASFAELFVDHCVILTPLEETDPRACRLIGEMWRAIGAEVLYLDPGHHDEVLAATSHLPHILAYTLVNCLAKMRDEEEIFKYAAGGFADFTRIASSNPGMWHDICLANRVALLKVLEIFFSDLERLKTVLKESDNAALYSLFEQAKATRDNIGRRPLPDNAVE